MRNRLLSLRSALLLLLLLCATQIASAYDFVVDGIYYSIKSGNKVTVTSGSYSGDINIPSSVTYGNITYSVVSISEEAFRNCSSLTSVSIPESVTSIGNAAFQYCISLTSINIPSSVKIIGDYTFYGCSALTSILIPESVTTIRSYAFSGCKSLTSMTMSTHLRFISNKAFSNCIGLTNVAIPETVTTIGESTFSGCTGLTSVTIPKSVVSIGASAFSGCTGLKSIDIQNKVIGRSMFEGCTGLTSITIPESVTTVENDAFNGCTGLTSVDIQNAVIGQRMFTGCTALQDLFICKLVTTIVGVPFVNCYSLSSITVESDNPKYDSRDNCNAIIETESNTLLVGCKNTIIPNSVTSIGSSAFSGRRGMSSIIIPNLVTSIGGGAFTPSDLKTVYFNAVDCDFITSYGSYSTFPGGVKEIIIGDGVTRIPQYFANACKELTSVNIPESVEYIGYCAFQNCTGLTSVTIPESITGIGDHAFYGCTGLNTVYFNAVNCGSCSHYAFPSTVEEIFIGNGVTRIPSGFVEFCTGLTSITIPESVTSIGRNAFNGCSQLMEVICLPITPPSLSINTHIKPDYDEFQDGYSFYGVPHSMVVYVHPAALEIYHEDYLWDHLNILPLENYGYVNLTVGLPDHVDIAAFTDMRLEIHQKDNGKKVNCIIGNHHTYTFGGIKKNTSWDIIIANHYGDVFGGIENVQIDSTDVNVTIASLMIPQTVNLTIVTPEGMDVTDQASITWLDENGEQLEQGKKIAGMPPGRQLAYSVKLPQELAISYSLPANMTYIVKDGVNNPVCQLTEISQIRLSGKVKDAATNQPLYGATISATQTFAGGITKTTTSTTDNQGKYTLDAMSAPTTLTIAAQGYINQKMNCDELMTGSNISLPEVALSPISGAVVNVNLTYTPAHAEGEVPETQSWYSDYNNVDYEVYNTTTGHPITNISVQYPQIILMQDVNDGDVLELNATSRKDAFKPVKTTVTIADQKAIATFDIKEWGKLQATFNKNINPKVTGTLYDSENKLFKTADYTSNILTMNDLPDGNYTLITMGKSDFFNAISDLDQFAAAGLQAGTDYAKSNVEINNGIISKVAIHEVPFLDETKFYYTEAPTSFTVNKRSIVIGNYFTFGAQVYFKEQYADIVTDVRLIVDLPESCPLYDNSVMVGNRVAPYTIQGNRLTIPLYNQYDNICFCATPTEMCDITSSAYVQFRLNGKTIVQPIGNVSGTVKGLSIYVPSITSRTDITISGTVADVCDIDIYDNGVLIGQTKSLANGTWNSHCELYQPKNLSKHDIHAVTKTQDGLELLTETVTCLYDKNASEVVNVEMLLGGRNVVTFDFLNGQVSSNSYSYNDASDVYYSFTFIVKFTNNDPSVVSNVTINVFTEHGGVEHLYACYDSIIDRWVAGNYYGGLPVNVSVSYDANTEVIIDAEFVNDNLSASVISQMQDEMETAIDDGMSLLQQLLGLYAADDYDETRIAELEHEVCEYFGISEITPIAINSQEEGLNLIDEFSEALSDPNFMVSSNFIDFNIDDLFNGSEIGEGLGIHNCDEYDESSMLDNGFEQVVLTDSTRVYYKQTETEFIIVSFINNIAVTIDLNTLRLDATNRATFIENAQAFIENSSNRLIQITDGLNSIKDFIDTFSNVVGFIYGRSKEIFSKSMGNLKYLAERRAAGVVYPAQSILEDGFIEQATKSGETMLGAERMGNTISNAMNSPIGKAAQRFLAAFDIISQITQAIDDVRKMVTIWNSVPYPCEEDQAEAYAIRDRAEYFGGGAIIFYTLNIASTVFALNAGVTSAAAIGPTAGISLTTLLVDLGIIIAKGIACDKYHSTFDNNMNQLITRIARLKCKKEDDNDDTDDDVLQPPCPYLRINHLIDPAGFVYEGVPSNRLQGVTTTCYYKETIEDMNGDQHEEVVLWDAEQYGQHNPLLTDENGYYRWDVPVGLWQVKYEKSGYETTYSDWLPVPPPQLDVNIGMVQMRQPEVIKAHAYPQAVELEFDKYMLPEMLTANNITVSVNGTAMSGTIELLNAEVDDPNSITSIRRAPGTGLTLASCIRFNAFAPFNAGQVTVHVNQAVKSYAGMQMNEDYDAVLYIESEMEKIVVDSTLILPYGDSRQVTVTVLPAWASKGKTLTVNSLSAMILSTDAECYTLDNNGQAVITVYGDLPGTVSLLYGIDGYNLNATTLVNVMMESQMTVAAPTATIANGSKVPKGTAVYLRCSTPGATIYYTLDGSCPCDNTPARKVYDGLPIIINGALTIKAMATVPDLYDSEVATFVYYVDNGLRGDVNDDGEINIADINAIIDIILDGNVNDDILERADVNSDGEVNIADINALIDIILAPNGQALLNVNCDDLLHLDDVTMKPGDERSLSVKLDNAMRYSAMQCDIVMPAGLTLVAVQAAGMNQSKCNILDGFTSRALTYSMGKIPFVDDNQPVLSFIVRADAALAPESEIKLTNIILADADNRAWCTSDCMARVNNASGINDLTVTTERVWVEDHILCIESRQDGIAQIASINGVVLDVPIKCGVTRHMLESGIYVVIMNGRSHKIYIK